MDWNLDVYFVWGMSLGAIVYLVGMAIRGIQSVVRRFRSKKP